MTDPDDEWGDYDDYHDDDPGEVSEDSCTEGPKADEDD
jgi:hypothetical protein